MVETWKHADKLVVLVKMNSISVDEDVALGIAKHVLVLSKQTDVMQSCKFVKEQTLGNQVIYACRRNSKLMIENLIENGRFDDDLQVAKDRN